MKALRMKEFKLSNFVYREDENKYLAVTWVVVCILGRLIPHPANFTPLTNLCLFAGAYLSKRAAFGVLLLTLLISDVVLAYSQGHPAFSSWTLFTYSGFLAMILLGTKISNKSSFSMFVYVLFSSFGFWLWTNLGVWLCSGMYMLNVYGLMHCYLAAIPFLRNALCGDLVWCGIMLLTLLKFKVKKLHFQI